MEIEGQTNSLLALCKQMFLPLAEIRGEGRGAFVYAATGERAAELSVGKTGFFIEGWTESDEDSNAPPAFSGHLESLEAVEAWLREWFKCV